MTRYTLILLTMFLAGDNIPSPAVQEEKPARLEYKEGYNPHIIKRREIKKKYHLTPDSLNYSWEQPVFRKL